VLDSRIHLGDAAKRLAARLRLSGPGVGTRQIEPASRVHEQASVLYSMRRVARGRSVVLLDGDNLGHRPNGNLGFDRRRAARTFAAPHTSRGCSPGPTRPHWSA
jgi:hypothetical protein